MDKFTRRLNFKRNLPKTFAFWEGLPAYEPATVIRCPVNYPDGTPIRGDDIRGCGSTNVTWDGEVYDCQDCCIFFSDYAADPPHRREEGED